MLGAGKTFINTSDSNKLASTFDPSVAGAGAVIKLFASSAGGSTATSTSYAASGNMRLGLNGQLLGGSLDANSNWNGSATLKETSGGTTATLGTFDFTVTSEGTFDGTGWTTNNDGSFYMTVTGTRTGSVVYSVDVARLSGSNFFAGAIIDCELSITPIA